MTPVEANPLLGTVLHAFGAIFAALCYTPQHKLRGWSWQTYWITQAAFCWLILPIIGAVVTIPDIIEVLSRAPKEAMLLTFVLGAAYGIGGTAFGIAHVRMGQFKFSSWAIHMIMLILFSSTAGIMMKEWHGRSLRTKFALAAALLVVVAAVLIITRGNFIGLQVAEH